MPVNQLWLLNEVPHEVIHEKATAGSLLPWGFKYILAHEVKI